MQIYDRVKVKICLSEYLGTVTRIDGDRAWIEIRDHTGAATLVQASVSGERGHERPNSLVVTSL